MWYYELRKNGIKWSNEKHNELLEIADAYKLNKFEISFSYKFV